MTKPKKARPHFAPTLPPPGTRLSETPLVLTIAAMENEVEGMAAFLEGRGKGKLAEDLRQRGQDMSDIMLSYGALRTVLLKTKRKAPRKGKVGARVGAASGGRK